METVELFEKIKELEGEMKTTEIKFTPEMLQATLEDRKTVTRRLRGLDRINEEPDAWLWMGCEIDSSTCVVLFEFFNKRTEETLRIPCPYGDEGDYLLAGGNRFELASTWPDRLHELDWAEAKLEGCVGRLYCGSVKKFVAVWNHCYGERQPWDRNPWVWVLRFRRIK